MSKNKTIFLIIISISVFSLSTLQVHARENIQLCLVIDGSGSISSSDWSVIVNGVADALESNLPLDGSIELSVVQFASSAQVEVTPTIITGANYQAVANTIRNIGQLGSSTATAEGIALGWSTITGSPNFGSFDKQMINLATDGSPNVRNNAATSDMDGNTVIDSYDDIIATVDNAVQAGLDELDMEGINITQNLIDWFRDHCVRPQPGTIAPPFDPGWIQAVADAPEFADAIAEKFEELNGITVGGELAPFSKLSLIAPYAVIALAITAGALGTIKKTRIL